MYICHNALDSYHSLNLTEKKDKLVSPFQELFHQLQELENCEQIYLQKVREEDDLNAAHKGILCHGFLKYQGLLIDMDSRSFSWC